MRVLFLHRYGPQAASFRYRFEQYFSFLERNGIEVITQSFFSDSYLQKKFKGKAFLAFEVLAAFSRRIIFLLRLGKVDAIVLYKDALPYTPFVFEYFFVLRRAPYLVDIDDALYVNYESSRFFLIRFLLGAKFKKIFSHAAHVLAGNATLSNYAKKYSSQVSILPTVVDLNYYAKVKAFSATAEDSRHSKQPFVIGWMGSPTSSRGLAKICDALKAVQAKHNIKIKIIGAGPLSMGSLNAEYSNWSIKTELDDLLSFDVGIMPLIDDDWDRGKCGFKLIQYMACGLPVVGSPVGVNESIIDQGVNGFLANSNDEWVKALTYFIENRHLLSEFGLRARDKVKRKYSLESAAPLFLEQLMKFKKVRDEKHIAV